MTSVSDPEWTPWVEMYCAGNPATGERWTVVRVRDAFQSVRGTAVWNGWLDPGTDAARGLAETAMERALAHPDFADREAWLRRYEPRKHVVKRRGVVAA